MKISIVQGAFLPVPPKRGGAVEKIWVALGREFARRGHDITHYSRLCDGLPQGETIAGVTHHRVPGNDTPSSLVLLKWRDLLYTRRVARILKKSDVVVTNTFWAPLVFSAKKHGPIWVHVQRYPKGQMMLYRKAARLQTVSNVIAEAMIRQAPSCRERVCIIANPLPEVVAPIPTITRNANLILFVGRVHPEKGLEVFLEAARLLNATRPELRFRIVGPWETRFGGGGPDFYAKLRALAQPLGTNVEFVGPVFDELVLASHYASSAVFVYPSLGAKGEASPLAPLEALARGCPVVTSDLRCFDDSPGNGPFSRRFNHTAINAAQDLAGKIGLFLQNAQTWERASAAAQARAKAFSLAEIATQYLNGFASVREASLEEK